jgi:hypothetical protein
MTTRPTLAEPITIAQFWRNRRAEAITVQLSTYQGRNIVDLRVWYTSPEGKLKPSAKGLAAEARHLPKLASALGKACSRAIELGLIASDDDDGGEQ